jgi:hypothetical protein
MPEPLAIWGAVTGTLGTAIATRREVVSRRRRLAVAPGVNLTISRDEPRQLLAAWALVNAWNTGGRLLAVEHLGFRYFAPHGEIGTDRESVEMCEHRAEIALEAPWELVVDGPSRKIYTPLGPMLAIGINPFTPVEAFAITTGGREWFSPPQPLIAPPPPGIEPESFLRGLKDLAEAAEAAPSAGHIVFLAADEPRLFSNDQQELAGPEPG